MSAITRRTNGSENSANGFIGIRRSPLMTIVLGIVIGVLSVGSIASGDETGSDENSPKIPELGDGWKRLAKVDECWINREKKQVAVGGHVCLTKAISKCSPARSIPNRTSRSSR